MLRLMMGTLLWICSIEAFAAYAPLAQSVFDEEIIQHKYYTLSYSEPHEVSRWVAYTLEQSQLKNCVSRTNSFKSDPLVKTGSAELSDYKSSGLDRGHLLPAGDMKWDKEAMKETFYFSNITPQLPNFNRGRWGSLEELVRAWTSKYKKLWIVTGPILKNNLPVIGPNQVAVPDQYYKAIIRQEGSVYKGIGILMGVDVPFVSLKKYAVSINKIEDLTDINFFPFLIDESAEESMKISDWDFEAKFTYSPCETE